MFTDEFKVKVRESNEKGKKQTCTEKITATVRDKRTEEEEK